MARWNLALLPLCHATCYMKQLRMSQGKYIMISQLHQLSRAMHRSYHDGFEYRSSLNCSRLKDLCIHQLTASVQIRINIFHIFTCRIICQSKPSYFPTETKKLLTTLELSYLLTGLCSDKVIHQSKFDETVFNA